MVKRTVPSDADFIALVAELDAELRETYRDLQASYDRLNVLPPDVLVALAYRDGRPVACGGLKPLSATSFELKRIFVAREYRRRGYARDILDELEAWAKERGRRELLLETGIKQTSAISLYEKRGYLRIANYGPYRGNPNSVCMRKGL